MKKLFSNTLEFWRGRLPHWEVADGLYFITIHLAGAIPDSVGRQIRETSRQLSSCRSSSQSVLQQRMFIEMERWLDRTQGIQHLIHPEIAPLVMDAVDYRSTNHLWNVFEYCLMPNHIHLLIEILSGGLKTNLESFKGWTGRSAGRILQLNKHRFWQREWFDHWVRSPEEAAGIVDYIRNNPVKAGLVARFEDWPYGSWR